MMGIRQEGIPVAGRANRPLLDMRPKPRARYSESEAATFSGTAYVIGMKTEGLTTYPDCLWVKCDVSNGVCTEVLGPPADPFPANEEWYEKAKTYGDIHLPRV